MKWFYNMKISAKLLTGFFLVALIAGFMGVFGIVNINTLNKADTELYEHMTVPISLMSEITTDFQRMRVNVRDMILANDIKEIQSNIDKISERRASIDKLSMEFEKLILSKEMQSVFDQFTEARKKYRTSLDKVIEVAKVNKDIEAITMITETSEAGIAALAEQDIIEKIIAAKVEDAKNKSVNNTKQANNSMLLIGILIAFAMIVSIGLGIFISRIISKPLIRALEMIQEMGKGHLSIRLKMNIQDEVGQMANAMDIFADDLQNNVIGTMNKIADGDVSMNLAAKDAQDEITPALKQTVDTLRNLITEANMLSKAAVEGKLDTRSNADMFKGGFKEIVAGVNKTLDSVIGPLNVAAEYMDRISKGDIPHKITDTYNGDFNEIKNNLNTCIDAVNALVADANMLSVAAVEGKLSTRADASKHGGDFGKIVNGVNMTLDAVIKPVQEAAIVLKEMSNGNLQVRVMGNYQGDHAEIKNALNDTLEAVSAYVNEISDVLGEMSNSNLQLEITRDYRGDFVQIKDALNEIVRSLNEVFSEMNNAADQVASGSRQVSDGSQALSQGATEQASSIEELTASITEIAAQTKQNAANANQANELAIAAKQNAEQGNAHMKGLLRSMEEINESSTNISKIIKVIDEIAFQTNILALNAAVEAARAGQHGKGFAVVAEEVRNLAARSANAAKETTAMIEGSIKKAETGTKIANETAVALDSIVVGVAKAANLVGEIATASNEQATGISQINKGIEQVSTVVQTNSATSEESAAASEELSSQAEMLKEMVAKFKLKRNTGSNSGKREYEEQRKIPVLPNVSSTKNRKKNTIDLGDSRSEAAATKSKISLRDSDFGKY